MAVDTPVQVPVDAASAEDRVLHLSAYVERPLEAVLDAFASAGIDELLALAVRVALEGSDGALASAHASTPEWVSESHAHVHVTWSYTGSAGRSSEGTADVSLLVVQSGEEAITELLVALPINAARAASATVLMHGVLDELSALVEAHTR